MKNVMLTLVVIVLSIVGVSAQSNFWYGNLEVGGMGLILTIEADNSLTTQGVKVKFGSPMQTPMMFDVEDLETDNGSVKFAIPRLGAKFNGTINSSNGNLVGKFVQGNGSFDITFIKSPTAFTVNRPQTPQSPFPYEVKHVSVPSVDDVVLGATVTSPKLEKGKKYPAVILVAGSGPNDRDETIFMHKPFAVIADYLTRNGYVVIRYDKRGIGKSTGSYVTATTLDFANDADAVFHFIRNYEGVDIKKVGIIGHSEGGVIAPIVAKNNPDLNFIMLLGAPSIDAYDIMVRQNENAYKNNGTPDNVRDSAMIVIKRSLGMLRDGILGEEFQNEVVKAIKICQESLSPEDFEKTGFPFEDADQLKFAKQKESPWFSTWVQLVPSEYLSGLNIPVFALYGGRDVQVYCEQNYPLMDQILKENGNKYSQTVKIDDANHLFQSCNSGSVAEYGVIEQTISPDVLARMGSWLNTISKAKKLNNR